MLNSYIALISFGNILLYKLTIRVCIYVLVAHYLTCSYLLLSLIDNLLITEYFFLNISLAHYDHYNFSTKEIYDYSIIIQLLHSRIVSKILIYLSLFSSTTYVLSVSGFIQLLIISYRYDAYIEYICLSLYKWCILVGDTSIGRNGYPSFKVYICR